MKLYVDTSALVKLLLDDPESSIAADLFQSASDVISSSIGYVEARSAIAKARGMGRLTGEQSATARLELEAAWLELGVIGVDGRLVVSAGDLADIHGLGAGDAIHLASALTLDESQLVFASWDRDLARAARESGLAVAP